MSEMLTPVTTSELSSPTSSGLTDEKSVVVPERSGVKTANPDPPDVAESGRSGAPISSSLMPSPFRSLTEPTASPARPFASAP